MSIRTKELILVKFYLIVLVTKFAIVKSIDSMDNEADNQLVALDDEESNDLNNLNQGNEFERIDPSIICKTPKFSPYLTVTRVTRTEIEFNITDINDDSLVDGYVLYYWGFRVGPKSSYRSEDRHFGYRNFTKERPFIIDNLRPKFSYCADLASFNNKCGHGVFCQSCFEQVLTL